MYAREYFEAARAAQSAIDRRYRIIESMRSRESVRAQRYDAIGSGGGGNRDAMHATDARIDAEASARAEIAQLSSEVEDARAVCAGVRAANPTQRWGDVLECRYLECMDWRHVALAMDMSERQAHADHDAALEWVDLVGIAAARDGMGQAALF